MLWVVFNVLVEVVVICFLGRDYNKASYGQQCVLTKVDWGVMCYTRSGVPAMCQRWWSPSPQPIAYDAWTEWAHGLQSRPLMKKTPVILHHCLIFFFFCTLRVLINVPLIGDNGSEFLSIMVFHLPMEGPLLASLHWQPATLVTRYQTLKTDRKRWCSNIFHFALKPQSILVHF